MSIGFAHEDGIAVVTLDDAKVNAMTLAFFEELHGVLDRVEREAPRAVVLTGRGGVFSAGLDLKLLPTLAPEALAQTLRTFGRTMLRVFTFPVPIVAALSGHAIAGGAMLAYACDLRVMADGPFRLHLNESAIGLPLPTWAILIAQSAVPVRWQTEAILHARAYGPAEALERGLVAAVAPSDRLLDEARALAGPLTALDTAAYAESKRRLRAPAVRWAEEQLEPELGAGFRPT